MKDIQRPPLTPCYQRLGLLWSSSTKDQSLGLLWSSSTIRLLAFWKVFREIRLQGAHTFLAFRHFYGFEAVYVDVHERHFHERIAKLTQQLGGFKNLHFILLCLVKMALKKSETGGAKILLANMEGQSVYYSMILIKTMYEAVP